MGDVISLESRFEQLEKEVLIAETEFYEAEEIYNKAFKKLENAVNNLEKELKYT